MNAKKITMPELDRNYIPYLAETLVMSELTKLGLYVVRLPPQFDYDLFCNNDARIEVKSASFSKFREYWTFHNVKTKTVEGKKVKVTVDRNCDFFVCVGFNKRMEPTFFIIPKDVVGSRRQITIRTNPKKDTKYWKFVNKWDLILSRV